MQQISYLQTNTHTLFFYLILLSSLFTSCTKDDIVIPLPTPTEESALKMQSITWNETDYQLFEYNTEGLLSRYTSQWNYIQNDPSALKKVVTNFTYAADKRLISSQTGNLLTKYYYKGQVLDKTEEYDHLSRLVITHHYVFDANKRLQEMHSVITDPMEDGKITNELKQTYTYDNRGNVTVQKEYVKKADGTYELSLSIHYTGYDDKKNAALNLFPHLLPFRKHINNPASETIRDKNDHIVYPVKTFAYAYNGQGYPVKKTTTLTTETKTSTITATISYIEEN